MCCRAGSICIAGLGVYEFRKMTLMGFSPAEAEVKRLQELGYKVPLQYMYTVQSFSYYSDRTSKQF
jgi:hypothetical protein